MTAVTFQVAVTPESAIEFARVSGDWNPLHTDAAHAGTTPYRSVVLHGAYSAGLLSRMAGMHLPGTECLLHSMRLRFIAPIVLPATLNVSGRLAAENDTVGTVDVVVTDASSGMRYVEGSYDFSRQTPRKEPEAATSSELHGDSSAARVLITGSSGGLGGALLRRLGSNAVGVSRQPRAGMLHAPDIERIDETVGGTRLSAIVHCAWPSPDNVRLTDAADAVNSVDHYVSRPLRQMMKLAQLLRAQGTPDAVLVLIGSTAAEPGRHNYRMPLYSLGKSLIPGVARILAVELGAHGQRCVAVVFDVVEAGMNEGLGRTARIAHAGRAPTGNLPNADEAAAQLQWVLQNRSYLISGAVLRLSGGAMP
jgi:NAD(P)-dependent dehydrogenase (short-subunit alcohol dehydrogenase family)